MSRSISFSLNEYYHIYARGTEKRKIFIDKKDHDRFVALLFATNCKEVIHLSDYPRGFKKLFYIKRSKTLVDIGAYCLMPNHFHILVREKEEGGTSRFMQKLMTGYTMYFNKKHQRVGALFSSKFKAEHANTDRYLKYLFSYIHLNPVKLIDPSWKERGIKNKMNTQKFLEEYTYSSFLDYYSVKENRPTSAIIEKHVFPEYFKNGKEFIKEIFDWLSMSRSNLDNYN